MRSSRRIWKRVRVGIVILALGAVLFTLLLCFLEKVPTLILLPYITILVYAVVGYRNCSNAALPNARNPFNSAVSARKH